MHTNALVVLVGLTIPGMASAASEADCRSKAGRRCRMAGRDDAACIDAEFRKCMGLPAAGAVKAPPSGDKPPRVRTPGGGGGSSNKVDLEREALCALLGIDPCGAEELTKRLEEMKGKAPFFISRSEFFWGLGLAVLALVAGMAIVLGIFWRLNRDAAALVRAVEHLPGGYALDWSVQPSVLAPEIAARLLQQFVQLQRPTAP